MTHWIDVAAADEFVDGLWQTVETDQYDIIIIYKNGDFFAIEDRCSHDGGSLSDGDLINCQMRCPRHGAKFDIKTGKVTAPPAYEDITTFPVRLHDGRVQVGIEE